MRARLSLVACLVLGACGRSSDHSENVQKYVHPLLEGDAIVGCVVGVFDDGRQQIYSFGETRRGGGQKPDGDTVYEIGSITKAFTGTLLADMASRDLVKLDASLQDFMPEGVTLQIAEDKPIKLVDLASQTSGLPRLPDNLRPADWKNPYVDYAEKQLFDFLAAHKPRRPPGKYEYSNLGVGLLGHLLARKSGSSYEQLLVERICQPLKMDDTRITLSDQQRERLATPYNAELAEDKNWDFDALAGCGAVRSTVNDLLKLVEASLSGDDSPVVGAIQEAWKPRYGKSGDIGVGLGWHIARDGVTRWHNGMTGGYSSALFIYPPKRMGVVVLCNSATDNTTALGEKLLQAALGMNPDPIKVRPVVHVELDVLKQYEGTYMLSLLFAITITVEDGKLMARATGQDKYQIFPESETKFFYKVVDAQISFEKGDDGTVNKLILHQNGIDQPGMKVPDRDQITK